MTIVMLHLKKISVNFFCIHASLHYVCIAINSVILILLELSLLVPNILEHPLLSSAYTNMIMYIVLLQQ